MTIFRLKNLPWPPLAALALLLAFLPAPAPAADDGLSSGTMGGSPDLRGVVMPLRQSKLSFSASGALTQLVDEGTVIKKGGAIARIDDSKLQVALIKARANLEVAELDLKSAENEAATTQRLMKEKIVSEAAILEAEFAVKKAQAKVRTSRGEVEAARIGLTDATLKAPFTGVVLGVTASLGEWVSPGTPILELADLTELELAIDAPPNVVVSLKKGATANLFDESGQVGTAVVKTLLPLIDPASGLRRIIWSVKTDSGGILAGRYVTLSQWSNP